MSFCSMKERKGKERKGPIAQHKETFQENISRGLRQLLSANITVLTFLQKLPPLRPGFSAHLAIVYIAHPL